MGELVILSEAKDLLAVIERRKMIVRWFRMTHGSFHGRAPAKLAHAMNQLTDPPPNEGLRKLIHIAFGFVAVTLKWLTAPQAAVLACLAFLFNLLVLPRIGGRVIARDAQGHDRGILYYPLAVLALILVFHDRLDIAATVWVILAFGDGAATLIGRAVGGRRLPWNEEKSWAGFFGFIEVAILPAYAISLFLNSEVTVIPRFLLISITVIACAIVESLPTNIDDNISVPFTGAILLFGLFSLESLPDLPMDRTAGYWLVVNAGLAVLGYAARSVTISGMIGGWVLGAMLILFGGWQLYVVLLIFFVVGTLATKLGYERKRKLGLAQERGGRRGFSHAFANTGLAAILAILIGHSQFSDQLLFLMAVAAFATATADTLGSEVGQWIGRRTFLPLTFRTVPKGTEGAVSIEGTLAGAAGALLIGFAGVLLYDHRLLGEGSGTVALIQLVRGLPASVAFWKVVSLVAVAGFVGSYAESILGNWNRKRQSPLPNGVMNFINTIMGAALFALFWSGLS